MESALTINTMQRRYTADSRSPTIGAIPSRNIPIRSTEIQNAPSLSLLLDGLRMQMTDDRKQQDQLEKTLLRIVKNVKEIRKRQDDYLAQILQALHGEDNQAEEEATSSHGSQAQVFNYGDDFNDFRAISEAEDSVLGHVHERDAETADSHELPQRKVLGLFSNAKVPSIPEANSHPETAPGRLHVDYVMDLANEAVQDDDTDVQTERDVKTADAVSASRMPTPVTPGLPQRRVLIQTPSKGVETLDLTVLSSRESTSEPITPTAAATSMRAPQTPTSKGKRKRIEKSWRPTQSAERPQRRAKTSATKKNKDFLSFASQSPRAQEKALREQSVTPWHQCGGCQKPTCVRCKEQKDQAEWSISMRTQ